MANMEAARGYGKIFMLLAANPTPDHKALAWRIFELSKPLDFTPGDMGAEEACLTLGIARPNNRPFPLDDAAVIWPDEDGYGEAFKFMVEYVLNGFHHCYRYQDEYPMPGASVELGGDQFQIGRVQKPASFRVIAQITRL